MPRHTEKTDTLLTLLMAVECTITLSTLTMTLWKIAPKPLIVLVLVSEGVASVLCVMVTEPKDTYPWIQASLIFVYVFHMLVCLTEILFESKFQDESGIPLLDEESKM